MPLSVYVMVLFGGAFRYRMPRHEIGLQSRETLERFSTRS
ncbi:MAG: hypothetical protein RLY14_2341 [Planctomycetota bacterium]|jgi:hypothetical protein